MKVSYEVSKKLRLKSGEVFKVISASECYVKHSNNRLEEAIEFELDPPVNGYNLLRIPKRLVISIER